MMKKTITRYLFIIVGVVIDGLAYNLFIRDNGIVSGGLLGVSQALNILLPWISVGICYFTLNAPLFLFAWKIKGFKIIAATLFAMVAESAAVDFFAWMPSLTPMDPMLGAIFAGVFYGVSGGILFSQDVTVGGTYFLAQLLEKKARPLTLGQLTVVINGLCLLFTGIVFGQATVILFGLICAFVAAYVMDIVLSGVKNATVLYIVSDRWENISSQLVEKTGRGVTLLRGEGAYAHKEKQIIMIAVKKKDVVHVKRIVYQNDADAFLIACDAHDVLGRGFDVYQAGHS